MMEEEEGSYKQDLGLKKLLYKYEHDNLQLRVQIKALSSRMNEIANKPKDPPEKIEPLQAYRESLLNQQAKKLYGEIEKAQRECEDYRKSINETQEEKCNQLQNAIRNEEIEIHVLQKNVNAQTKSTKPVPLETQVQEDALKLASLELELETLRKSIREMQHRRDSNNRVMVKRHVLAYSPKKHFEQVQNHTQEQVAKLREAIENVKKETAASIGDLKQYNSALSAKLRQLKRALAEEVVQSTQLPKLKQSQTSRPTAKSIQRTPEKKVEPARIQPVLEAIQVGPNTSRNGNDKNYLPKQPRQIEWCSATSRNGIQWNDSRLRSPITGVNLWIDGSLLGLQILHALGESEQHLHLPSKGNSPIQYRLATSDYVENIILVINEERITGVQFRSKNGKVDTFGAKKGKKFDFGAKKGERLLSSFGKFRIRDNVSEVICLGFQIL